jgi:hypothetical protein
VRNYHGDDDERHQANQSTASNTVGSSTQVSGSRSIAIRTWHRCHGDRGYERGPGRCDSAIPPATRRR